MSDGVLIALVVASLYAVESLAVVPEGAVVFLSNWARRYVSRSARHLLRVNRGRLVVLNPAWARSSFFISGLPTLALDEHGVGDTGPEEANARMRRAFVRWEQIGGAATCDGRFVRADGLGLVDCGTARNARLWARALNALRAASAARRRELTERWLRLRFSTAAIRRRLARVDHACRWLEMVMGGFFFSVLVWGGAVVLLGRPHLLVGLLLAGELLGISMAVLFWRAHRSLHPGERVERWGKAALMALCFPAALRARAALGRDALAFAHPVAVAAVLQSRERACDRLRATVLRWLSPMGLGEDGAAAGWFARARNAHLAQMRSIARELGPSWESLIAAPRAGDASLQTYCPRCHATYALAIGVCADCPGVPLVALIPASRSSPARSR